MYIYLYQTSALVFWFCISCHKILSQSHQGRKCSGPKQYQEAGPLVEDVAGPNSPVRAFNTAHSLSLNFCNKALESKSTMKFFVSKLAWKHMYFFTLTQGSWYWTWYWPLQKMNNRGHLGVRAIPAPAAAPQTWWDHLVPLFGDMPMSPGPGWPVCAVPPEHWWSAATSDNWYGAN